MCCAQKSYKTISDLSNYFTFRLLGRSQLQSPLLLPRQQTSESPALKSHETYML